MMTTPDNSRRAALARLGLAAVVPLSAAAGLGGCATNTVGASTVLKEADGLVALRVVNLMGRSLDYLEIQHQKTQERYKMSPQSPLAGNSVYFTGIVPAGEYKTTMVGGSTVTGAGPVTTTTNYWYPLARAENTFSVATSTLTNLGTLVLFPLSSAGGSRFIAARDTAPLAARDWLSFANPALAKSLTQDELGWSKPAVDEKLNALALQVAASSASLHTHPLLADDGTTWTGGKMGSIQRLEADRKTKRFQTGTINQILAVLPLADGRILAAGESGYVAVSTPDRRTWKEAPAPVSRASVGVALVSAPDGDIYLVSQTPDGVTVFKSGALEISWKEVRRFDRTSSPNASSGWAGFVNGRATATAVRTASHLVVYCPDPRIVASMPWSTGQWAVAPTSTNLEQIYANADGTLYGKGGAFGGNFTSLDQGKSWIKADGYAWQSNAVFTNAREGYMLAEAGLTWNKDVPKLRRTKDGGKTWESVGDVPVTDWRGGYLVSDDRRKRILYVSGITMRWTDNEGSTWN